MLKRQAFGVEIEMTGITRAKAANIIAEHFNSSATFQYGAYRIFDSNYRIWKVVRDGSIITSSGEKVEVVTPKLNYNDIETLLEIVRKLRKAGAKSSPALKCGIHIHVDAANHTPQSIKNLVAIMASKEDILFRALNVGVAREIRYCKKVETATIQRMSKKIINMDQAKQAWYGDNLSHNHKYHQSRYHALNLHAVWFKGTVEFRMFNGTMHAGEIKAYIHLALAISAQAITQKSASFRKTASNNEKYTFRTWLLRLGMIGDEFKNTRAHLLKHLDGDSAWRYGRENARVA